MGDLAIGPIADRRRTKQHGGFTSGDPGQETIEPESELVRGQQASHAFRFD